MSGGRDNPGAVVKVDTLCQRDVLPNLEFISYHGSES